MKHKIKKAINLVVKKMEKLLRKIYHKMPISHVFKTKAKNVFFTIFGFCLKNTPSYIVWKQTRVKKVKKGKPKIDYSKFVNMKFEKSIAVQLHLFYVDLMQEFVDYLNNIPYDFDLFISVIDDEKVEEVRNLAQKIKKVNNIEVHTVENRGRDVAPFLVEFGSYLNKYDYVCHLHSKKSLYTGSEQSGWRRTLLEGLMGTPELVTEIFYNFETNPEIGLIYPETWAGLPYWGHNWLTNTAGRDTLMEKLGYMGIEYKKYFDFPMGTMFFARKEAIKKFFNAKIKLGDFPVESGQVDGTIAHAFERCLGVVTELEGYKIATYDTAEQTFNYQYGHKNFRQYWDKSCDLLKDEAYRYDIVTFDIFDTLIMRYVVNPDDLFNITELKLKNNFGYEISYKKIRKKAEKNLRKRGNKPDYTLDEIYDEFEKISGLDREKCDIIKNMETENEIAFCTPRYVMIDTLKYIKTVIKKKVVLISDMYLPKDVISKMLSKCGVDEYDELIISCEANARKDTGKLWDSFIEKNSDKEILHIGDNEVSDTQLPGDRGIRAYHILSAKELFELTDIGLKYKKEPMSPIDSVCMGTVLNKYFNNPFEYNKKKFKVKIEKPYDLGYAIIGPIVADYIIWTLKNIIKNKNDKILFLAREGYLLKQVYEILCSELEDVKEVQAVYLYASRRAMSVCNIKSEKEIRELLNIYYEGSLVDLLYSRFGITTDKVKEDFEVVLPADGEIVYKEIKNIIPDILENAKIENERYLKYFNEQVKDSKNMAVSDIGYAGTIQYYLSAITDKSYDGYYFATDNKKMALKIPKNTMTGRYIENEEIQQTSKSYIYRYSLMLETLLTSNDNQFIKFDSHLKPVFRDKDDGISKDFIREVHKGAVDYTKDIAPLLEDIILSDNTNKNIYEELLRLSVEEDLLSEELKKQFILEDNFCKKNVTDVFKSFNQ